MTGGVGIWDANERLIQCNAAYRAVNRDIPDIVQPGTTLERRRGRRCARSTRSPARAAAGRGRAAGPGDRRAASRGEGAIEYPVGADTWTRLTASRTKSGGFVSLFTDISELRQRQRELAANATSPRRRRTRRKRPTRRSRPSSPP
jgi:two-component system cell cycle sensor histidine kinase PleC